MHERVEDRKRLQKYEHTEVTLDDDQSDELSHVVHTINAKSPRREILSQIFEEAENQGKGQIVQDIWESNLRLQFNKDQARNGHYPIAYTLPSPPFSLSPLSLRILSFKVMCVLQHFFCHCRNWKEKQPLESYDYSDR